MTQPDSARLARRRRSIRRQALLGAAIVVAGCVWGVAVVGRVGQAALDRDPTPLLGALAMIVVGAVVLAIARYRRILARPGRYVGRKAGRKVLEEISELLE